MDMDVGVKIDSPTPMKALGIAMLINPLAAPVNAVKILSSKAELRIELGNKARQLAVSRFDKKNI